MSKALSHNLRCNEQIRITPIRLIGENNDQVGVIETYEALKMARNAGLDLVEVAPNERPPVCRIMDYGKWKYHQKKNVKKHHEQQLKELRLRPKTDEHDREIKIKRAIEFLSHGDKVQFTMVFRGRERAHREIANEIFQGLIAELVEHAKIERPPVMDGRNMVMIVAPLKPGQDKGHVPGGARPAAPAPVPAPASASAAAAAAPAQPATGAAGRPATTNAAPPQR
jgi:translation initiation factor IF-3